MKVYLLFLVLILQGCYINKNNHSDYVYYENRYVNNFTIYDNEGTLVSFWKYDLNGILTFKQNYHKSIPDTTFIGSPYTHVIWNKKKYFIGDTIKIEIDHVKPPNLDYKFYVNDKLYNNKLNKYNNIEYTRIAKDSVEFITLYSEFYFKNELWISFKRSLKLHVNLE